MGSCDTLSENKMKLIVFLATIVLVSAKSIKIDQLEYGFCDGADTSVGSIDAADVQPFPVEVKTGATVTISATLTLSAVVQTGSTVSLNIVKEGIVDLPIPCLEIDGLHIGSCSYDADYLLTKFSDFLCPAHVPDGQACATPLNPGTYGGGDPIVVEIPEIPDIIAGFLGSGEYHASATVTNPDNSMMTCIQIKVDVVG